MTIDSLLKILFTIQLWDIIKVLLEIGLLVYIIFSVIVIRQVDLMGNALGITLTPILRILALIEFFVAIGIFVFALLIL
jgi:hypothetical protein